MVGVRVCGWLLVFRIVRVMVFIRSGCLRVCLILLRWLGLCFLVGVLLRSCV